MPLSQRIYRLLGITLLSGALVLLLLLSVTSVWLVGQNRVFAEGVSHTQEVLNRMARLRSELRTIESSQRGYLLSQDPSYLNAYELTRLSIDPGLEKLRGLISSDAAEGARVDQARQLAREKLAELAKTVTLAKAGRFDEAIQELKTNRGFDLMRDLEGLFDAMTAAENQALASRTEQYNRASAIAQWLTIVAALATAALAGGFWLMTARYLATLRQAQAELANVNASLEQRVQDRTAALRKANEEVQRFAYIVSHDLRSPLVNIMGFTSELEAARILVGSKIAASRDAETMPIDAELRQTVEEELPEAIGFIRTSALKMDRLIKAILQLSREGTRRLTPETVELGAIVAGIRDSLKTMVEAKGAEIVVETLPTLISDRLTVEQILSNLIENAVKYLSPGRPGRIVVSGRTIGGDVEVAVADNGRGIDARDMERVFELFRRAGVQDQPGEGIGLANVRAQATRLGGTVTCRSTLGQGSTFTLTLPRVLSEKTDHQEAA